MSDFLFNDLAMQSRPKPAKRCKECRYIQRRRYGTSVFFYCGVTKSRRTECGFKKVKCKTPGCELFEMEVRKRNRYK